MGETVIVTGARAPVAHDIARSLRAYGCEVHFADCAHAWVARALRPEFPVHRLPPPRTAFGEFRRELLRLLDKTSATRIIPTCEEVFWLAEAAKRDGFENAVFAPPPETLRQLHSKAEFVQLAQEAGLLVPETQVLDRPISATEFAAPEELVFKPEYSRFATHTLIGPTAKQVLKIQPDEDCRWVAQQRIEGDELCSWSAVHGGKVTAFAAYRPRWRSGNSAAFQLESVESPALYDASTKIAAATGLSGHLSFDAICDHSGETYLIECNPRAVSGLHLFDGDASMASAILGERACDAPPLGTLRHMGPAMALIGVPMAIKNGQLKQLRSGWRASRDVIDREGNPLVTLACLADAAGFTLLALRNSLSPAAATTSDIEWNGGPIG
ncbi:ATP-grasp domain-containing protein [uncultured Erythrobacter sp.]|uniref:ATP-grasp domain-containing protein n=1 Tax=uncultured Erythrobacter sp. TaxID=263913 RepID=UPI00263579D2|nr:ATP-grasp domain-containing protein [uncultured Erythrobacter sp.]